MSIDIPQNSSTTAIRDIHHLHYNGLQSYRQANFRMAKKYCKKAINRIRTYISSNNYVTQKESAVIDQTLCDVYLNLCKVYIKMDKYPKALNYAKKSKDIAIRLQDQMRVARCLDKKGQIQFLLNHYRAALKNLQDSLNIKLKLTDAKHNIKLDIAQSYYYLSMVYDHEGQYDISSWNCQKALDIRINLLGEQDIDTIESHIIQASILQHRSKYNDSISILRKCLDSVLHFLRNESNHYVIANLYDGLGHAYNSLGNFNKAKTMFEISLKIRLDIFGDNHSNVATSYINISSILIQQAKYEMAQSMLRKSMRISLNLFGNFHSQIAEIYNNIGILYWCQGEYHLAGIKLENALAIRSELFGYYHISVAASFYSIARVYASLHQSETALSKFNMALSIILKIFKHHDHYNIAKLYLAIGNVYFLKCEDSQAIDMFLKSQKCGSQLLGDNCYVTALSYYHIGIVYTQQVEFDQALLMYQKSLNIILKSFGNDQVMIAELYFRHGIVYCYQLHYDQAVFMYQKCLNIEKNIFGNKHIKLVIKYQFMGDAYRKKINYSKAIENYQIAVKIYQSKHGGNRAFLLPLYRDMQNIYEIQGNYRQATVMSHKIQRILKRH